MPFGLTNAPSTFMRTMNNCFRDMLDECVVVFLDDILIYSKSYDEHVEHIRKVLQRLRQHQFYAKLKKCEFFKRSVTFLGHDISEEGVRVNGKKIAAVQEWPVPKDATDVRSFLGFCQFYRNFIKDFAAIAKPLTDLMKAKVKFAWGKPAFQTLKAAVTTAPCLKLIDLESTE